MCRLGHFPSRNKGTISFWINKTPTCRDALYVRLWCIMGKWRSNMIQQVISREEGREEVAYELLRPSVTLRERYYFWSFPEVAVDPVAPLTPVHIRMAVLQRVQRASYVLQRRRSNPTAKRSFCMNAKPYFFKILPPYTSSDTLPFEVCETCYRCEMFKGIIRSRRRLALFVGDRL